MKKLLTILFALFVLFNCSGVNCQNVNKTICKDLSAQCDSNIDCCNLHCSRLFFFTNKHCSETFLSSITKAFSWESNEIPMKCVFLPTENPSTDNDLLTKFGLNAAHYTLPPHTYVDVMYYKKTIQLQINNVLPKKPFANNKIELSVSAADKLGLQDFGEVDCNIRIPFWQNHPILKRMTYFLGVGAFISTLILYNNMDLYM